MLGLEKEHEIDVNGTDTLWGETGNYESMAYGLGQPDGGAPVWPNCLQDDLGCTSPCCYFYPEAFEA